MALAGLSNTKYLWSPPGSGFSFNINTNSVTLVYWNYSTGYWATSSNGDVYLTLGSGNLVGQYYGNNSFLEGTNFSGGYNTYQSVGGGYPTNASFMTAITYNASEVPAFNFLGIGGGNGQATVSSGGSQSGTLWANGWQLGGNWQFGCFPNSAGYNCVSEFLWVNGTLSATQQNQIFAGINPLDLLPPQKIIAYYPLRYDTLDYGPRKAHLKPVGGYTPQFIPTQHPNVQQPRTRYSINTPPLLHALMTPAGGRIGGTLAGPTGGTIF